LAEPREVIKDYKLFYFIPYHWEKKIKTLLNASLFHAPYRLAPEKKYTGFIIDGRCTRMPQENDISNELDKIKKRFAPY
jgi:hypothetical protein